MGRSEILALTRTDCPVCGHGIRRGDPIREWKGTWRHRVCALKEIEEMRSGRA